MQPTEIEYYKSTGAVKNEFWHKDGEKHREDGPAWITYDMKGNIQYKRWYLNGKEHRIGGPSTIAINRNGILGFERWMQHGKKHRIGGPAKSSWYADGTMKYEEWLRNDEWHCMDGPAVIWYSSETWNACGSENWFIAGYEYTFEEWLKWSSLPMAEKVELKLMRA